MFVYTRRVPLIFLLLLSSVAFGQEAATPKLPADASSTSLSEDQIRELIRHTAANDMENDKRQRDYTYIQREEQHKLDGNGQRKSTETKTTEIMELYGEPVERLLSKDDKPLSDKDARKEEEKIQKVIEKRKNESEKDRKKRDVLSAPVRIAIASFSSVTCQPSLALVSKNPSRPRSSIIAWIRCLETAPPPRSARAATR